MSNSNYKIHLNHPFNVATTTIAPQMESNTGVSQSKTNEHRVYVIALHFWLLYKAAANEKFQISLESESQQSSSLFDNNKQFSSIMKLFTVLFAVLLAVCASSEELTRGKYWIFN